MEFHSVYPVEGRRVWQVKNLPHVEQVFNLLFALCVEQVFNLLLPLYVEQVFNLLLKLFFIARFKAAISSVAFIVSVSSL